MSLEIDRATRLLNTESVNIVTIVRRLSGSFVFSAIFACALVTTLGIESAHAAMTLTTGEEGIQVYSGPGERFRVLAVLPIKTEIKAANQIVTSSAGRFYRVLIKLGENQRAIGFIPVNTQMRVGGEDQDEDELSKYGAVALISRAAQVTFSALKDRNNFYSVGYMHYLSPGFYIKGTAGQLTSTGSSGNVFGGEIGNDSLLAGSVSGFVSYGLGLFMPNAADSFFAGSTNLNVMMNATIGIRYNLEGFASFAVGGQQIAIYNQNNSFVTTGVIASLEVGL